MSMRIDFYLLRNSNLAAEELACRLTAKSFESGRNVLILSDDDAQRQWLDELLWTFDPQRFIPHGMVGSADGQGAPVRIGDEEGQEPVVIDMRDGPPLTGSPERVLDVVADNEAARTAARNRYRGYRAANARVQHHEIGTVHG